MRSRDRAAASALQRLGVAGWIFGLVALATAHGCATADAGSGTSAAPESVPASAAPIPLEDPIPRKIARSALVVEAVEFLRVPKTRDPHDQPTTLAGIDTPLGSSGAHARLQYMTPVGDGSGRLAISDLRGVLYIADAAGKQLDVYLDLREAATDFADGVFPNEAGFLGFAFHPNFGDEGAPGYGKFYTGYSATPDSGEANYLDDEAISHESVVREWTATDPTSNTFVGTSREVMRVGQFAQNHNVGTLAFNPAAGRDSPDDGALYICLGDGGSAYDPKNHGQSLNTPLGSILRIDPLAGTADRGYGIPADNPFVDRPGAAPEIWAYGLRHPQHFSFDRDGRLFINDIGQNHVEEVNVGVAGANYGWRVREGHFATGFGVGIGFSGFVFARPDDAAAYEYPIAQYDHDEGNAIGGGYVYRGSDIPELRGHYVLADLVNGRLFHFDLTAATPTNPAVLQELRVSFDGVERDVLSVTGYPNTYAAGTQRADLRLGIDDAGELYLLTKGDGWIRKLARGR